MPKVAIVRIEKARVVPAAGGANQSRAYCDGANAPLHLHLHDIAPGGRLRIEEAAVDRVGYVWRGAVSAGNTHLPQGSSVIVEHGRSIELAGGESDTQLLLFSAADASSQERAGGHVHLLPADRAPRLESLAAGSNVGGVMHADSSCPSSEVWLHENHFPGGPPPSSEQEAAGVHSHTEDEIIFVTGGQIRLGAKLYGPGTAVAIAGNTLYGFTAGPEGLSFVNFRAGRPGDISFADGRAMSETGYWRERVPAPQYIEVPV